MTSRFRTTNVYALGGSPPRRRGQSRGSELTGPASQRGPRQLHRRRPLPPPLRVGGLRASPRRRFPTRSTTSNNTWGPRRPISRTSDPLAARPRCALLTCTRTAPRSHPARGLPGGRHSRRVARCHSCVPPHGAPCRAPAQQGWCPQLVRRARRDGDRVRGPLTRAAGQTRAPRRHINPSWLGGRTLVRCLVTATTEARSGDRSRSIRRASMLGALVGSACRLPRTAQLQATLSLALFPEPQLSVRSSLAARRAAISALKGGRAALRRRGRHFLVRAASSLLDLSAIGVPHASARIPCRCPRRGLGSGVDPQPSGADLAATVHRHAPVRAPHSSGVLSAFLAHQRQPPPSRRTSTPAQGAYRSPPSAGRVGALAGLP